MRKLLLRAMTGFLLALFSCNLAVPIVYAETGLNADFQAIYGDHSYYEDNKCDSTSNAATPSQSGTAASGNKNPNIPIPANPPVVDNTGLENGNIPADKLVDMHTIPNVTVTGSSTIRKEIADKLKDLAAAFKTKFNKNLNVLSGYRTKAEQQQSIDSANASGHPNAAAPIGQSSHGWGLAIDVEDHVLYGVPQDQAFGNDEYKWLATEGVKMGWKNPYYKNHGGQADEEPWHWEYGTTNTWGAGTNGQNSTAATWGVSTSTPSQAVLGDTTAPTSGSTPAGGSTPSSPGTLNGLRDQIAQMLMPLVTSEQQANDAIGTYHVGGIFVNTPFFDGAKINAAKAKFSPTPFVGLDQEGGKVDRLGLHTKSAEEMGKMSVEDVKKVGADTASKIKAIGGTFDAAPVLDLAGGSPAVNAGGLARSFGTDPNVVAEKAAAFADGLKSGGITPTFKHFPGIGGTTVNSDQQAGDTPSIDQLKGADLKPYEKVLPSHGDSWVMMSNYNVPGLTGGAPASISKAAYDLLKNDYKFGGIIITDDLNAGGLGGPGKLADNALGAIKSGADIALFTGADQLKAMIDKIEQAANADPALKQHIEQSSAKLVAAKNGMGASAPKGGGCCGSSTGATELIGSDNAQKVWNYLTGKGLTPEQTAGVMGNMQGESGVNPRRVEGTPTPSGDSDTPDSRGYGIVQFTPGTKIVPAATAAEKSPGDLGFQLDFIWEQITTGSEKAAGDALKASTDIESATDTFLRKYERPADPDGTKARRVQFAKDFFAQYGSGAPSGSNASGGGTSSSSSSGGSSCGGGSGSQGPTGGTFSWPEDIKGSTISQCFTGVSGHPGLDIFGGPDGVPVYASAAGTVVKAGEAGDYGPNFVVIKHDNGYGTSYGHMMEKMVNEGDKVTQGQQIGKQGNLGYSKGSHVHFNVFPGDYGGWDSNNVDPLKNGLSIPAGVNNPHNCD